MTELPSPEEILRDYGSWLRKVASAYLPGRPADQEDLAQEGNIAMWRALRSYDPSRGALPSWLTTAARVRMAECARRDLWTGTPSARGHVREKPATPVASEFLERLDPEMFDGVLMAYHHGEIMAALSALPPGARQAVFRRFWLDEPVSAGYWSRHLPRLREALDNLRDCF